MDQRGLQGGTAATRHCALHLNARKQGDFAALVNGHTYRFDPDDFFGRNLHSKSEYAQVLSGWQNARVDQLLEEAKKTLDPARRKELYTEVWNIDNVELAQFHLHEVTHDLGGGQRRAAGLPALCRRCPQPIMAAVCAAYIRDVRHRERLTG